MGIRAEKILLWVVYGMIAVIMVSACVSVFFYSKEISILTGGALYVAFFYFLLKKGHQIKRFLDTYYFYFLAGFLILLGIMQVLLIDQLRYVPAFDLDAIYGGAVEWTQTGVFPSYYDYFYWFPNNLGGLCFLHGVFKLFGSTIKDYFFLAACVNEALILSTIAMISLSARKLWGSVLGVAALVLCLCMPPFLFMTNAFYTDSLSLFFPVCIFYISLLIDEKKGKTGYIYYFLSAIAVTFGSFIKATVLIMAVAVSISFLLRKQWKKCLIYIGCIGMASVLLTMVSRGVIYGKYLDPVIAEQRNTPYYHWIMMGLKGDGGYNPQDYDFTRSFETTEQRDEALKDEIVKRVTDMGILGMGRLYSKKLYKVFGDGTLGISDFLDDTPQNETKLHEYILYDGSHYNFYSLLCNSIFYAMLVLAVGYILTGLCSRRIGKGAWEDRTYALVLALGGITFFLMNWETSGRYITNFVPVMMLLALGELKKMISFHKRKAGYL